MPVPWGRDFVIERPDLGCPMNGDGTTGERLSFLDLDQEALDHLRSIRPIVMSALPAAIQGLYKKIRSVPAMRKFCSSEAHIDAAANRQISHWDMISSGTFDETYVGAVTKVGQV